MLFKSLIVLTLAIALAEGQDWRINGSLPTVRVKQLSFLFRIEQCFQGNYSSADNADSQSLSHLFSMAKQFVDLVFPDINAIYGKALLRTIGITTSDSTCILDYAQKILSNQQTLTSSWQEVRKNFQQHHFKSIDFTSIMLNGKQGLNNTIIRQIFITDECLFYSIMLSFQLFLFIKEFMLKM